MRSLTESLWLAADRDKACYAPARAAQALSSPPQLIRSAQRLSNAAKFKQLLI